MKNFIKSLYGVNKNIKLHFISNDKQVDWQTLSNEFSSNFELILGDRKPVGKVTKNGFEFELNYMNYWLVLPSVVISQSDKDVTITQFYYRKLQYAQIFLFTILLLNIFLFSLGLIDMVLKASSELGLVIGATFSISMCLGILGMILILRRNLWWESLEKAKSLLELAGVKTTTSS